MKIALTGIKPTGTLHIGNYFGAMKGALSLAERYDARYFIADYHALNSTKDPALLKKSIIEVAAGWLAAGLDPSKVVFYRQSAVPQTFELSVMLTAFTSKGLLNRAHAYKAAVEANAEKGADPDAGVNMGLFTYPVLMAADILLFDSDFVPVGRDQVQHIEMAQDIAQAFNFNYGKDLLKIPQAAVGEDSAVVAGTDGRKMSKSYGNVIPLFCSEKELKKLIMRIVTNSQGADEPKDPESSGVFALYKLFAGKNEYDALAERCRGGGLGWGNAKEELFHAANAVLSPIRERFNGLLQEPANINKILEEGALKARALAEKTMERLREAAGISF